MPAPERKFSPYSRIGIGPAALRLACGALFAAMALASAAAAPCPDDSGFSLDADQIRGVRAKWQQSLENRDARYSIQPELDGLSVGAWMKKLEAVGVNLADLNLDPCVKLVSSCNPRNRSQSPIAADQLTDYLAKTYETPRPKGKGEKAAQTPPMASEVPSRIAAYAYTPEQRDQVLIDFLRRLETAKSKGEIAGNVRFLIHQRIWFRSDLMDRRGYKERFENAFISDMAGFINAARAQCLDHWIAGIRLGEHSNKRMDEILPIVADLAGGVNAQTGGWLRSHMMLMNGGGWGAVYNGIDSVAGAGGSFDFFKRISKETGSFAFGYKWMDSDLHPPHSGIRAFMAQSQCDGPDGPGHRCNPDSTADWETYLRVNDGFDELEKLIHAQAHDYPRHANVLFVGDSSDSLQQLVDADGAGGFKDTPQLTALRKMFAEAAKGAGGWSGRMFVNAFMDHDQMEPGDPREDIGRALYFADASPKNGQFGSVTLMPRTLAQWRSWPARPAPPRNRK